MEEEKKKFMFEAEFRSVNINLCAMFLNGGSI